MTCPRCHGDVAPGQEYCLDCGLRLPGEGRLGAPPVERRRVGLTAVAMAVLAALGGAAAIAATWENEDEGIVITATGGSKTVEERAAPDGLVGWPKGRSAWTIVVASVPKARGRAAAVKRATAARERGLPDVGVLDSSTVAGLRPGAWIVFSGVYGTQPEANAELQPARAFSPTASTRRIARD